MKKTIKKILAILLTISLLSLVLVACAKDNISSEVSIDNEEISETDSLSSDNSIVEPSSEDKAGSEEMNIEEILKASSSITIHKNNQTYGKDSKEYNELLNKIISGMPSDDVLDELKSYYDPDNMELIATINYDNQIQTRLYFYNNSYSKNLDISKIEIFDDGTVFITKSSEGVIVAVAMLSHVNELI